jgi:Beta-propeller repeat/Abnormal spindle-like microcephaly-assoc'd, ASPM-SPD-2-Hydin
MLALRKSPKAAADVLRIKMIGANPKAQIDGADQLAGKTNYFIGKDPKKWRRNVPLYSQVRYRAVYPGIDLIYHGSSERQLEYDFVLAPKADPARIAIRFEGARRISLSPAGDVIIRLADGSEVIHRAPTIYQDHGATRTRIDGRFVMRAANEVGFELAKYDRDSSVDIDPALVYSTYLGGSGSDMGDAITVDSMGYAYVTGTTTSPNFPTMDAFQATNKAPTNYTNAFVTKLNTDGTGLVYSTYLGGSTNDAASGIAVDSMGYAYIAGTTDSTDFPTTSGAYQTSNNASNGTAFLTKLSTDGSSLVYSTYLGGNFLDGGAAVAVDSNQNAYVTGGTQSSDFPNTEGPTTGAFVTKFSTDGATLVYSTQLGGGVGASGGSSIAVDSSFYAYITGTALNGFPTTPGAFQTSYPCAINGCVSSFVTKLMPDGSAPAFQTYLGGSGLDYNNGGDTANSIAVDSMGFIYVAGTATSQDFPTTAGAFQTMNANSNGTNAFVTKIKADGSGLVYSSYLGGFGGNGYGGDGGRALAVDSNFSPLVTGVTNSSNSFPTTTGALYEADPTQDTCGFVTKFSPDFSTLEYSTYLCGDFFDTGLGIAVDSMNIAYITGVASSKDFPTTMGAFQTTNNSMGYSTSGQNAFVTKLDPIAQASASPTAAPTASGTAAPTAQPTPSPTPVGPAPTVKVTKSINFGKSTMVNATSKAKSVSVKNASTKKSGAVLNVTMATTNNPAFQVTGQCAPSVLTAGKSCKIDVTFMPTNTTPQTGTLTIEDNGSGGSQTVPLSGTGKAPKVKK